MNFATRAFGGVPALGFAGGPAAGPPLLLLHGVTRGGRDWQPILPELTWHWRVLALDLRGHGGSGRAEQAFLARLPLSAEASQNCES